MNCKHELANHTIDRGQIFLSAKEIFLDRLRAQWLGTDAMLLALVNHVVDKIEESQELVSVQARSSIGHTLDITTSGPYTKIIAWCPDDTDENSAREYFGDVPEEIAERHAKFVHKRSPCSGYTIRVRATSGEEVHEWDILVNVEVKTNVAFRASHVFRVNRAINTNRPW